MSRNYSYAENLSLIQGYNNPRMIAVLNSSKLFPVVKIFSGFSEFQNEFTFVYPKEFKLTLYSLCNLYFYLNHISNDKISLKFFIRRNTAQNLKVSTAV